MFCSKCGRETTENAVFCSGCGAELMGKQPAKKKQLSLAAGIIDIVAGSLSLVSIIYVTMLLFAMAGSEGGRSFFEEGILFFVPFLPLVMVVPAVLAIVGGIFALRRRRWVMALIGAIALILPSFVAGIAAVVLTVMARDEFE